MNVIRQTLEKAQVRWLTSHYRIGKKGYRRIYFYHVQKAGGSSIRRSFYNIAEPIEKVPDVFHSNTVRRAILGDKVYVSHHVGMINQGNYFFASSHLPMSSLTLPENSFTFTCLRDPVKRFLSRYRELLFFHAQQSHDVHLEVVKNWFSADFMEMLDRIPDEELLFQLRMFSATYDVEEAVENISNLSYFFLTSAMEQGIRYLSDHLELPLTLYHNRKTDSDYQPSDAQMALLQERLQPEIEMFERVKAVYNARVSG